MIKKSYQRLLEISDDYQQVTMPDSRYYRRNGNYYPSVTHVLGSYPKGKYFEDWLKKVGYSAEWIVKKAAEEGTLVHEMIEDWLNGKEITFLYDNGNPKLSTKGNPLSPTLTICDNNGDYLNDTIDSIMNA